MKINKLTIIPFLFLLLVSTLGTSQGSKHSFCSHDEDLYKRVKTDPDFKREVDSVEAAQLAHLADYITSSSTSRAGTIYYIPVVYHVLHEGGVENISDAQIKSDLKDLNDIYRKRNSNVGSVNPAFTSIAADIEIEFRLAQKKNDGSCFSGITRTLSSATNGGGNPAADAVKAAHGDFPGNKYMNIYISKSIASGAAGYTYRPGPPYYADMRNGIHVLHTYVGNIGTSSQTGFNTTIAHEAGHWLNLPHLWGSSNTPGVSSNCLIDDGIGDTPNTIGWQSCNTSGVTCGTLDNVENIMEYSYCSKMFTTGQKNRMRAAITSSAGGRSNLITNTNQLATGIFSDIICEADIATERKSYCQGESVQFLDNSFHNPTSWSWSFPGGTPSSSNAQNPTVTYNHPGRHNVSLTVSNASGSKSITKSRYIRIVPSWGASLPYSEGFEINQTQFEDGWETTSSTSWSLSNSSSSGSKSVMLKNFALTSGVESELVSRTLNLTGNASVSISFKYAYARKSSTSGEIVQFLISNNCGDSWVIVRGLNPTSSSTNSEFFPTSWGNQNINISNAFFTPNFRFKIRVVNGNGNNLFIDDININNVVGIDELEAINSLVIYPNPMINSSTISVDLNKESTVSLSLINMLGETVNTIVNEKVLTSGNSSFELSKNSLSSGVYFVKITVNGKSKMEKLVIN